MIKTQPTLAIHGGEPVRSQLLPYGHQQIDEDDIRAVVEVLRSEWVTTGPKVEEFEEAFAAYVAAPIRAPVPRRHPGGEDPVGGQWVAIRFCGAIARRTGRARGVDLRPPASPTRAPLSGGVTPGQRVTNS